MKKIFTSMMVAVFLAVPQAMMADEYFFSPEGAGEMDGSSWENAASGDLLGATIKELGEGDAVYLMEGNYLPDVNFGYWQIPAGVTIKGGYPTTMTGTDTAISYPTNGQSVWSADLDGDGEGDNGKQPFVVIGEETGNYELFAKTVIAGITIRDCVNSGGRDYGGAAMYLNDCTLEMDHCFFLNNKLTGKTDAGNPTRGGIIVARGCWIYFHDCVWRDNKSGCVGVAFQGRQSGGGTTENGGKGCYIIMDRCELSHNTVWDPITDKFTRYGGALAIADWGGTLVMVNSTVTDSHISWAGGMCRMGTGTTMYAVNNTWFNCTCNFGTRHSGDILSMGTASTLYSMGNIAVTPTDDRVDMMSTMFIQEGRCKWVSGGYNVWGSLFNASTDQPAPTDDIDKSHTQEYVFGDNEYTETDKLKFAIEPKEDFRGVPVADLQAFAEEIGLPEFIDVTVDMLGNKRPDTTVPGAYDNKGGTTGVQYVVDQPQPASQLVYDLQGRRLNAIPQHGLFIINGKKVIK